MTITITRKQVLALSRLDLTGLGHSRRLDAIAKVLGLRNQATMMAILNRETPTDAPQTEADGADLLLGDLERFLSGRTGLFVIASPTTLRLESLVLRLAERLLTESLSAPSVIIIRDSESARRAVAAAEHGLVIGCVHGETVPGAMRRIATLGLEADAEPRLCGMSALRRIGDTGPERVAVSIYGRGGYPHNPEGNAAKMQEVFRAAVPLSGDLDAFA